MKSRAWPKQTLFHLFIFVFSIPQDDYPLASLPLLGYSVTIPSESENIHKDYVFKLHFKSHVYYFRSESEYTFERCACTHAQHIVRAAVLSPWCQRVDADVFVCPQVDGSDPQCHSTLQEHSCPEQQRVQPSLSPLWFYSGPPYGGICNTPHYPSSHQGLCFSLLHISGTFVHVSMHIWCFF